jgi:hypothetical protein
MAQLPQPLCETTPVLAGQHDVEDQQIEDDAPKPAFGVGGVRRLGNAVAVGAEIAFQQIAQPAVVIDDQDVGRVLQSGQSFSIMASTSARSPGSINALSTAV